MERKLGYWEIRKSIGRNADIILYRRYEIKPDLEIKISRGRVYMYTHG